MTTRPVTAPDALAASGVPAETAANALRAAVFAQCAAVRAARAAGQDALADRMEGIADALAWIADAAAGTAGEPALDGLLAALDAAIADPHGSPVDYLQGIRAEIADLIPAPVRAASPLQPFAAPPA